MSEVRIPEFLKNIKTDQEWLDIIGSEQEIEKIKELIAELEEDPMWADGQIGFVESDGDVHLFEKEDTEGIFMKKRRGLLLKAVEHNWDEIGPGDWETVTWFVFYDGSYEIVATFSLSKHIRERFWMIRKQEVIVKKKNGKMENKNFLRLQKALQQEPWKDPALEVDADDGVAWEIESYREDGSVEKSSGKLGYIYGHRNLERIVSLLPSDGNIYDSKAFVAINGR